MPIPDGYTESSLAAFMGAVVGPIGAAFALDPELGAYDEAVTETLLAYGVADVAQATDVGKLRALARREAWRVVVAAAASAYDFSLDQQSFSRRQLAVSAAERLQEATVETLVYDVGYSTRPYRLPGVADPYQWSEATALPRGVPR